MLVLTHSHRTNACPKLHTCQCTLSSPAELQCSHPQMSQPAEIQWGTEDCQTLAIARRGIVACPTSVETNNPSSSARYTDEFSGVTRWKRRKDIQVKVTVAATIRDRPSGSFPRIWAIQASRAYLFSTLASARSVLSLFKCS